MKNRNELNLLLKKVCKYMDESGDDSPLVMLVHFIDEDNAKPSKEEAVHPMGNMDLTGLNDDGEEVFSALMDDLLAFASIADRMYISMLSANNGLITLEHAVEEAAYMISNMNKTLDQWDDYVDTGE